MVNDIKNSKYFASFREYIKEKSLDIQALTYSDLVIEYENFLIYNNITFNQHFSDLKQDEFIKDFEYYLNTNQKFTLKQKPRITEIRQNNSKLYLNFDGNLKSLKSAKLMYTLNNENFEKDYKLALNDNTLVFDFNELSQNSNLLIDKILINNFEIDINNLDKNITISNTNNENIDDLINFKLDKNYSLNDYEIKPKLADFNQLLIDFIKTKMNNDKTVKNIYNYLKGTPIDNLETQSFDYLNNETDKSLNVVQPNLELNEYDISFVYNLDPNKTIISFIKDNDSNILNLSE
ncbi:UNVERIFIED_CONTAM: hypothetical protein O8I53_11505 [Campylobacter lari]